jgi:hypothetical protein
MRPGDRVRTITLTSADRPAASETRSGPHKEGKAR